MSLPLPPQKREKGICLGFIIFRVSSNNIIQWVSLVFRLMCKNCLVTQTCVFVRIAHGKRAQHMRALLLDFAIAKGQRHVINLLRFRRLSLVFASFKTATTTTTTTTTTLFYFSSKASFCCAFASHKGGGVSSRLPSFEARREMMLWSSSSSSAAAAVRRDAAWWYYYHRRRHLSTKSPLAEAPRRQKNRNNNNACGRVGKRRALCASLSSSSSVFDDFVQLGVRLFSSSAR